MKQLLFKASLFIPLLFPVSAAFAADEESQSDQRRLYEEWQAGHRGKESTFEPIGMEAEFAAKKRGESQPAQSSYESWQKDQMEQNFQPERIFSEEGKYRGPYIPSSVQHSESESSWGSYLHDLSQDPVLYSERVNYLLRQVNIETFLSILASTDDKGNNIFHLMAGVEDPKHREFFTREMDALVTLFSGAATGTVLIGGVEIVIPVLSEDSLFVQAVEGFGEDQEIILRQAEEKLESLKKGPAIEFIKAVYARDSQGRTLIERFADPSAAVGQSASLTSLPVFSRLEEFVKKWQGMTDVLNRALGSYAFLYKKNNQDEKTIDIAYRIGNPHAYRILKRVSSIKDKAPPSHLVSIGMAAGVAPVVAAMFMIPNYSDHMNFWGHLGIWMGSAVLGGAAATLGYSCYRAVTGKIKKKKLEELD